MFNLSQRMEETIKNLIKEMKKEGAEYKKVPETKEFYVTTSENQEDILLGKTTTGGKTYYVYQVSPE